MSVAGTLACMATYAEAEVTRQLRSRVPAQAGNRAGKTGCQQQWWDKGSEWKAEASAMWKLLHSTLFCVSSVLFLSLRYFYIQGGVLSQSWLLGIVMFS